jgi:hypothetical protein
MLQALRIALAGRCAGALLAVLCLVHTPASADQAQQLFSRGDRYNYVPTTIRTGNHLRIWWCGGDDTGATDNIFFREIDVETQTYGPIRPVLQPTPGTWDSAFACDPSVVQGDWQYPPGSGERYSLAMFYTGTDDHRGEGSNNGIGVSFSNDGVTWIKHPTPIFRNPSPDPSAEAQPYGIGQQSVLSADGRSALWIFVLERPLPGVSDQWYTLYYSPDGLQLERKFRISRAGIEGAFVTEADFAYDPGSDTLYMVTDRVNNVAAMDVYQIKFSELETGTWRRIKTIDEKATGNLLNGGAGFLRDPYGRNTPFLPQVQVFFGSGRPGKENINTWQLWWYNFQAPP